MPPITEEAFWYMAISGVATATFAILWVRLGQRMFLIMAGLALLVTIGMGVFEAVIVTPREEVETMLDDLAREVQSNNIDGVLPHIHSSADQYASRAKSEMPNHSFEKVTVTKIVEINIRSEAVPPTASVEFLVSVKGDFFGGQMTNTRGLRAVTLDLQKENDQWKIIRYSHRAPQKSMLMN